MSDPLCIIARIVPAPGTEDRLEAAMKQLVEATREEEGCLQYDLHRTTQDPCLFVFVESWQSKALWEAHMKGEAIAAFNAEVPGMIESGEILQLRRVA